MYIYYLCERDRSFCFLCIYINVFQKKTILYIILNYNDYHHRKTTCTFYYIKEAKQIAKRFKIQKAIHFSKSKTISVSFFIEQKPDTLCYTNFHEIFLIDIYIRKG